MSELPYVPLFKEHYADLPIYKRLDDILGGYENCDFPREEFITRVLMAAENGLNWDTLCMNCGELMDHNYAFAMQNAQLKEDIERVKVENERLRARIARLERDFA